MVEKVKEIKLRYSVGLRKVKFLSNCYVCIFSKVIYMYILYKWDIYIFICGL